MQELSKFKVFTVLFICLFIFVVGVIYTNTKEMAENKAGTIKNEKNIQDNMEMNIERRQTARNKTNINELNNKLNELTERVNNIENNDNSKMNCKVQGVMTENGLEALSEDSSLAQARNNGKTLVLTCSF